MTGDLSKAIRPAPIAGYNDGLPRFRSACPACSCRGARGYLLGGCAEGGVAGFPSVGVFCFAAPAGCFVCSFWFCWSCFCASENAACISFNLGLHSGVNCFSWRARHSSLRPLPYGTSLQKRSTSSKQARWGIAAGFAGGGLTTAVPAHAVCEKRSATPATTIRSMCETPNSKLKRSVNLKPRQAMQPVPLLQNHGKFFRSAPRACDDGVRHSARSPYWTRPGRPGTRKAARLGWSRLADNGY